MAHPGWIAKLNRVSRELIGNEQLLLALVAVAVGTAGGYGALAFRYATDIVVSFLWGTPGEATIFQAVGALPWWQVVLIPSLGGLALGLLCHYVLPKPLPQGVSDVMEAAAHHNGRISWRSGWGAAFLNVSSIGVGASVGREGPIVHLAAALASTFTAWFRFGALRSRTILGCGVAAGVAAAFNAPFAGVFFALEVVVGHYGLGAFMPVVIASLMGTVVTRVHMGDVAAFELDPNIITSFWELPAFLLLGAICAVVSIALMGGVRYVDKAHKRLAIPFWLRPAIAGLVIGIMGLWFPRILGVGYELTTHALNGELLLSTLIILAIAKTAATALCLGSRFGGGIFSPSLAIGALTGGAFGLVAAGLFPDLGSSSGVYATLGMGAVAASVLGAPISTVIMIFELTLDYGLTFALMGSVAVATVITRQVYGHSFFEWQLSERGISIEGGHEFSLLRGRRVSELLRTDHAAVPTDLDLQALKDLYCENHAPIFVVDESEALLGAVPIENLADAAFRATGEDVVTALDIAVSDMVVLLRDDDLATAFYRCQHTQFEHIPVVLDRDRRKLVGFVRFRDLMRERHDALIEARAIERGRR